MATIVIESAEKGGSLVTADFAQTYNREVFAVPGRVNDTFSQGCHKLIKQQKAQMITSAADVIYMLGWEVAQPKEKVIQKQMFVDLDANEQKIVDFLHQHQKESLDTIALACELPIFKVSSVLLSLEMKGLIKPLPGKYFEAI
jgi:DNA processing protein